MLAAAAAVVVVDVVVVVLAGGAGADAGAEFSTCSRNVTKKRAASSAVESCSTARSNAITMRHSHTPEVVAAAAASLPWPYTEPSNVATIDGTMTQTSPKACRSTEPATWQRAVAERCQLERTGVCIT